jgi:hypothetical protein
LKMAVKAYARHRIIEESPKLFLLIGCAASHYCRYDGPDRVFAPFSDGKGPLFVLYPSASILTIPKLTAHLRGSAVRSQNTVIPEFKFEGQ